MCANISLLKTQVVAQIWRFVVRKTKWLEQMFHYTCSHGARRQTPTECDSSVCNYRKKKVFASHHLNGSSTWAPAGVPLQELQGPHFRFEHTNSKFHVGLFMLSNCQINISHDVVTVQTDDTSTRRHDLSHTFDGFMPVEVVHEHNTAQMNRGNTCTLLMRFSLFTCWKQLIQKCHLLSSMISAIMLDNHLLAAEMIWLTYLLTIFQRLLICFTATPLLLRRPIMARMTHMHILFVLISACQTAATTWPFCRDVTLRASCSHSNDSLLCPILCPKNLSGNCCHIASSDRKKC